MDKKEKKRLDVLVHEQHQHLSRNQIQSFIMQGKVSVDGTVMTKVGTAVPVDAQIELSVEKPKYVSRAGFKLEAALEHFNLDVSGLIVLDAGISTGGFTDCLLQRGARRVYGIDVGKGLVHETLRNDPRLMLFEETNVRYLAMLPEHVDLITLDLSFISVLKVIPAVVKLLKPDGKILILIKPQFEAEREQIGKGGVVKDDSVHAKVIKKIEKGMQGVGFYMVGVIESPILGATSGNKEFLALFARK
ncbi:MAG: TlyA family RNA methyltransferase [bacterium]